MSTAAKKANQEQFCSLIKELGELGLRPADAARLLKKTPGAISQYISGYASPSGTVLELLRRIVEEKRGEKPDGDLKKLIQEIYEIKRGSPEQYEVVKGTIEMLHQKRNHQATVVGGKKHNLQFIRLNKASNSLEAVEEDGQAGAAA